MKARTRGNPNYANHGPRKATPGISIDGQNCNKYKLPISGNFLASENPAVARNDDLQTAQAGATTVKNHSITSRGKNCLSGHHMAPLRFDVFYRTCTLKSTRQVPRKDAKSGTSAKVDSENALRFQGGHSGTFIADMALPRKEISQEWALQEPRYDHKCI